MSTFGVLVDVVAYGRRFVGIINGLVYTVGIYSLIIVTASRLDYKLSQ